MRFTEMGRDRKYEIRDTKYGIETNVEGPREVQCTRKRYEIRDTKYEIATNVEGPREVQCTRNQVQSRDSYCDRSSGI